MITTKSLMDTKVTNSAYQLRNTFCDHFFSDLVVTTFNLMSALTTFTECWQKDNHSTQDSRVVPHRGTNWAAL
jgi:hypothetical protein